MFQPQTKGERIGFIEIGHDDGDQADPVRVALWGVGATGKPMRYMYYTDHLGSVRATIDSTGEVVHYDDYSPFGVRLDGRSLYKGQPPKERYTGHELDEETDLYYAGARYLDPVIGRWLAVDPLEAKYPTLSPYNYVANNPLVAVDPNGEDIWFVHGTFSSPDTWLNEDFDAARAWSRALDDRIADRFDWRWASKANTGWSRRYSARRLAKNIAEAYQRDPDMLLQIVAHSHGGNVAILASNILKKEYGISLHRLVLLGTPSRSDYRLAEGAVIDLVNVHSENDFVQIIGGFDFNFFGGLRIGRPAERERTSQEIADEVDVTVYGEDGSVESHKTLHTTREIIEFINKHLNQ